MNWSKFRFNGQEEEKSNGLDVIEMDWRQYDAGAARFFGIDLLAEQSYALTPYHFAGNNPIVFADPSGLKPMIPKDPAVPSGGGALGSYGNMMNGNFLDNVHNSFWATGMGYGPFVPGWGSGSGGLSSFELPGWANSMWNKTPEGGSKTFEFNYTKNGIAWFTSYDANDGWQSNDVKNEMGEISMVGFHIDGQSSNGKAGFVPQNNMSVEELMRNLLHQQVGYSITGNQIYSKNPNDLSAAKNAIKSITKVKNGYRINLTAFGKSALFLSKHDIPDGTIFQIKTINLDNIPTVKIEAAGAEFFGEPLKLYIRGDTHSMYGIKWTKL